MLPDPLRRERRDVVLDDLLDLRLELGCDRAGGDLLEERSLRRGQVLAELSLPLGDLVDGDGVELGRGRRSIGYIRQTAERHVQDR